MKVYTPVEYQKYRQSELSIPSQPVLVKVDANFQRNSQPLPAASPLLQAAIEHALKETRILVPYKDAENTLQVTGNNIADPGQAFAKGFGTGLTLGLIGSRTEDFYDFSCSYINNGKLVSQEHYKHAILGTVGNKSAPVGAIRQPGLNEAFQAVVTDVVVNCLGDLQKNNHIPKR